MNAMKARYLAKSAIVAAIATLAATDAIAQPDAYEEFQGFLLKAARTPNYRADYTVKSSGNPTQNVSMWLQTDKLRMDTAAEGNEVRLYRIGETTTTCLSEGGSWNCLVMPNLDKTLTAAVPGLDRLDAAEDNPERYRSRVTRAGQRTVAGEPTTCFQVEEPEDNSTWLGCYSDNHGIPLHMSGKDADSTWDMTATDFQTPVPANAFTLPAKPQTLPGIPGGLPF